MREPADEQWTEPAASRFLGRSKKLTKFWHVVDPLRLRSRSGRADNFAPDDLDRKINPCVAIEERTSLSPDALPG